VRYAVLGMPFGLGLALVSGFLDANDQRNEAVLTLNVVYDNLKVFKYCAAASTTCFRVKKHQP
jgi:hypothetical protein